jgi:hypothetical protein
MNHVYFDADVDEAAGKWLLPYMTAMWTYARDTYGTALKVDRLYSLHHEGRYFGGHPSTVYDASHDFRFVSDVGGRNWRVPQYSVVTHETAHIVESASSDKHGSPAFDLWGDSKWAEFYLYDIFQSLGLAAEADDLYRRGHDDIVDRFPRPGTRWFRDWFYPLWRDNGHAQVMVRFFALVGQHFPTRGHDYARKMNWGEYVHFMSGAARQDLRPLARKAFGWSDAWEAEYQQARKAFPQIRY